MCIKLTWAKIRVPKKLRTHIDKPLISLIARDINYCRQTNQITYLKKIAYFCKQFKYGLQCELENYNQRLYGKISPTSDTEWIIQQVTKYWSILGDHKHFIYHITQIPIMLHINPESSQHQIFL